MNFKLVSFKKKLSVINFIGNNVECTTAIVWYSKKDIQNTFYKTLKIFSEKCLQWKKVLEI